jgi:hypothetical protein
MIEDGLNEKHTWIVRELRWALLGANLTFFATTVADLPNQMNPWFPGWYGILLILAIATIVPIVWLLFTTHWRRRPISERLGPIFSFAALEWLLLLALGLKLAQTTASSLPQTMIPIFIAAILLTVVYGLIQRQVHRALETPESMFP